MSRADLVLITILAKTLDADKAPAADQFASLAREAVQARHSVTARRGFHFVVDLLDSADGGGAT